MLWFLPRGRLKLIDRYNNYGDDGEVIIYVRSNLLDSHQKLAGIEYEQANWEGESFVR